MSTTTGFARRMVGAHEAGIALVLLALCFFLSLASPHFLTAENLAIVARQVSLIAVIAIGMTLVILLGGIDLSVGSVVALASVVVGYTMVRLQLPIAVGILAALLAGVLIGAVNGWL